MTFSSQIHRDKHIISHDNEKYDRAQNKKCGECGFVFYTTAALTFHMASAHLERYEEKFLVFNPRTVTRCQKLSPCVLSF